MEEIKTRDDVKRFVSLFYASARKDELIGPVFNKQIPDKEWPKHIERITGFWNTVLFGVADYRGNPFSHHTSLPIESKHFDRWIFLLTNTIETHFEGEKADEVLLRANKMAIMFQSKLEYLRKNSQMKGIM